MNHKNAACTLAYAIEFRVDLNALFVYKYPSFKSHFIGRYMYAFIGLILCHAISYQPSATTAIVGTINPTRDFWYSPVIRVRTVIIHLIFVHLFLSGSLFIHCLMLISHPFWLRFQYLQDCYFIVECCCPERAYRHGLSSAIQPNMLPLYRIMWIVRRICHIRNCWNAYAISRWMYCYQHQYVSPILATHLGPVSMVL